MKGRVEWDNGSHVMVLDWDTFVEKPRKEGYYIEAFGSADALIDGAIDSLLRVRFEENQDVINLLQDDRELGINEMLKFLVEHEVIDTKLSEKIQEFKGKRNRVLHDIEAEYSLVLKNRLVKFSNQEELYTLVVQEANKWLREGQILFYEIHEIASNLTPYKY